MTDFETLVRESLMDASSGAPRAEGLAEAAGRRLARRRRRRTTGAVAAVVLVALAVPLAMSLSGGGGDGGPPPPIATETPGVVVPDGWRVETWRDLEVQVPESWQYGALSAWCLGGPERPGGPGIAERPGGTVPAIGCMPPSNGYGVQFFDPTTDTRNWVYRPGAIWQYQAGDVTVYPEGSWLGYEVQGSGGVLVVAPDRATADQILDSARQVEGLDSNGCAPRDDAMVAVSAPGGIFFAVCRYGADGWLQQSERLSSADSARALEALTSAPVATDTKLCSDDRTDSGDVALVLFSGEGRVIRVSWGGCPRDAGIFEGGKHWALTEDVMFWALSPGFSGGFGQGVPLPDHLRR